MKLYLRSTPRRILYKFDRNAFKNEEMRNCMIENYSITEWIAFFFIYSFLGWCIESAIVSFNKRKLTNRGFLKGSVLPLYGSGAVIMLLSTLWAKD